MEDKDKQKIWTIYNSPPDRYVVRLSEPDPTGLAMSYEMIVAPKLEQARKALPPGLTRIPPSETDDPSVVESWM